MHESTSSLITDQKLVTKVYFPRALVPIAACVAAAVDLLIGLVVFLVIATLKGYPPTLAWLLLPLALLFLLISALGFGFWFSALNVEYRDVSYTVPFLIQFGFFLAPVLYPSSALDGPFGLVYAMNPMVGVIECFRWCLLGAPVSAPAVAISAAMAVVLFLTGLVWFRFRERRFVDVLGS